MASYSQLSRQHTFFFHILLSYCSVHRLCIFNCKNKNIICVSTWNTFGKCSLTSFINIQSLTDIHEYRLGSTTPTPSPIRALIITRNRRQRILRGRLDRSRSGSQTDTGSVNPEIEQKLLITGVQKFRKIFKRNVKRPGSSSNPGWSCSPGARHYNRYPILLKTLRKTLFATFGWWLFFFLSYRKYIFRSFHFPDFDCSPGNCLVRHVRFVPDARISL